MMMKQSTFTIVFLVTIFSSQCLISATRSLKTDPFIDIQSGLSEESTAVWRALDENEKEIVGHWAKFAQGLVQMICGGQQKDTNPKVLVDGIHQTLGSLIDMIVASVKRSRVTAVRTHQDVHAIIESILQELTPALQTILKDEIIKNGKIYPKRN